MLAHKLVLEDVVGHPFKLIGIHSTAEDYKLAFLLNKYLSLNLSRTRHDIDLTIKSNRILFALYKFDDQKNYCNYYMVSNKYRGKSISNHDTISLFGDEEIATGVFHLLPEFGKVDYFLKIEEENDSIPHQAVLEKINRIPQVATAYLINEDQLKSKQNLIFD